MDKIKVFENLLNKFETEEIKSYCTDMIKKSQIISLQFQVAHHLNITTRHSVNLMDRFSYSYVCRSYELYTWVGVCKRKNK